MSDTNEETVLLVGNGKLAACIYMCLTNAGHVVDFYSENPTEAIERVNFHVTNLCQKENVENRCRHLKEIKNSVAKLSYKLAIIITAENILEKTTYLHEVEKHVPSNIPIAINIESIALSTIQKDAAYPSRIIGVNWSEPAHTTYFLEIITNESTPNALIEEFYQLSKSWQKDPYILHNDCGIRARMMCAMIREAFYLVENGYVSIEDIDRACRNDAGFYLPFAGNFRYMDLMGTYMYGVVMKDLNPELCNSSHVPKFFKDIIADGGEGMENNHGIYSYENGDTAKWDDVFKTFSYQIQEIIHRYSSDDKAEEDHAKVLITSMHE